MPSTETAAAIVKASVEALFDAPREHALTWLDRDMRALTIPQIVQLAATIRAGGSALDWRFARLAPGPVSERLGGIARWAGSEITSVRVPDALRDSLLPSVEGHRDPSVGRRAVLARAKAGAPSDLERLEHAALDRRALVRRTARAKLAQGSRPKPCGVLGALAAEEHRRVLEEKRERPYASVRREAVRAIVGRDVGNACGPRTDGRTIR